MSKTLKVTGNHGKFARFVLLPVSDFHIFFIGFSSMYNKTIIRFGFCNIQNNQGLVKGYQPLPISAELKSQTEQLILQSSV